MNLNEECLLHYLGHFKPGNAKTTTAPVKPVPAAPAVKAYDLSQIRHSGQDRTQNPNAVPHS